MTASTIHELVHFLPDHLLREMRLGGREANYVDAMAAVGSGYEPTGPAHISAQKHKPKAAKFAVAYCYLDFGWRYARMMAKHRLSFPSHAIVGDDEVIFRAYVYFQDPDRYGTQSVYQALALTTPEMSKARRLLHALLVAKDATLESVAAGMCMEVDTIRVYEKLFFNVLDRRKDMLFMQNLIYPHGRLVEMLDQYFQKESLNNILLRAGYNNGPEDVMFLAGGSKSAVDSLAASEGHPKQLESLIMAYGYLMARNGALNQETDNQGLLNARQLLGAGKIGGSSTENRLFTGSTADTLRDDIRAFMLPQSLREPVQRR